MSKKFNIRKLLSMALLGTGISFSGATSKPMSVSAASNVKVNNEISDVQGKEVYEKVTDSERKTPEKADKLISVLARLQVTNVWPEENEQLELTGKIVKGKINDHCLRTARDQMETILRENCYIKKAENKMMGLKKRWVVYENTKKRKDYVECYESMAKNYMKTRHTDITDQNVLENLTSSVRNQIDSKEHLDSDEKDELNALFIRMINELKLNKSIIKN